MIVFPRQKLLDIPEAMVQKLVLAHLGTIPGVKLWRMNVGGAYVKGRWVDFGVPGQADLSGLMGPSGRRLEVELKALKGVQGPKQKVWQHEIESRGGLYIMPRTLEEAVTPVCDALGLDFVFDDEQ